MSAIISDIKDDLQRLEELKRKIGEVKQELMSIDVRIEVDRKNSLEGELKSLNTEYRSVAKNISQAEGEILKASKGVDAFTEKIIDQKDVVKEVEADVKRLAEAYRNALKRDKYGSGGSAELAEYQAAKKALEEERVALFKLTQEKAKAQLKVKGLRDEYNAYKNSVKGATDATANMGKVLGSIKGQLGGVLAGFGIQQLISDVIKVRGEFQQADTAIQTMLGSKAKADQLLAKVREYAKISPLEFGDITRATQMMLGFNIEAEKVPGFIKAIGDVSMGESGRFNSLTLAFSQMSATGKLMGQDLNQMINAGFNPLSTMAEKSGKSIAKLKEEMSKGAITAEMVQQAFIDATSAGGKFYGMSENAAKTINGQLSMMHDAIDSALNEVGTASEGIIMKGIQGVTSLIENYEQVGKVILGLAATYGTYRTAVMLVAASEKMAALSRLASIQHTNVLTLATKALAAQTGVLNAVMSVNPYVLAATAIAGLVAVMWNMKSAEERVQEELDKYNQQREEAIKKDKEHQQRMQDLIDTASNEQRSTVARKEAMAVLIQEYPEIFKKYDTEIEALKHIYEWKEKIAEIEGKKVARFTTEELSNLDDEIAKLEEKAKRTKKVKKDIYNNQTLQWERKTVEEPAISQSEKDRLAALRKKRDELKSEQQKQATTSYLADLTGVSNQELDSEIRKREDLIARIKVLETKGKKDVKAKVITGGATGSFTKEELEGQIEKFKWEQNRRKKAVEDASKDFVVEAKKAYDRESKSLKDLQRLTDPKARAKSAMVLDGKKVSGMGEEEFLAAIKKQQKAVDEAKSKVDAYNKAKNGGSTKDKSVEDAKRKAKAEQRLADLVDRQKREQARKAEDLQFSTREAEIKAMDEGTAKTLKQIELDRDKEIAAIRRAYEDMRLARIEEARKVWEADPKNEAAKKTGKGFFDSDEFKSGNWDNTKDELKNKTAREIAANKQYGRAVEEQQRQESQYLYDYLKEYGSVQQKREAIAKEYNEKIAKEQNAIQRATLEKQKEQALSEIDFKEWQNSIDWERVFGDIDRISTDALRKLKDDLRNALDAKDITVENAKILAEKINELDDKIVERTDAWAAFIPYLRERARLTQQVATAEQELKKAQEKQSDVLDKTDTLKFKASSVASQYGINTNGDLSVASLKNLLRNLDPASEAFRQLKPIVDDLIIADTELASATDEVTAAEKKKKKAEDDKNKQNFFKDSIKKGVESAGGGINYALQQTQELNELIDTIGLHDTEFGQGVQEFTEGANSFASAAQKFQSGDIVGGITDTIKGFQNMGSLVERIGGFSFNGSNAEEVKAESARIDEENEGLRKAVELNTKALEQNTGMLSIEAHSKAVSAQENVNQNLLDKWANEMGYHDAHHSNSYYYDIGEENAKKLSEITGETIRGDIWEDLMQLTPEQMAKIRDEYQDLWKSITSQGYYEGAYEALNEYADQAGKIEEINAQLMNKMLGTSQENIFDQFLDSLYKLADGAEGVYEDLEEGWRQMVNKMVIDNIVGDKFKEDMQKWSKEVAELTQEYAEGKLTAEEYDAKIEAKEKEREAKIQKAEAQIEDLKRTGVIEEGQTTQQQQSASFNSAQNITYEQADSIYGAVLSQSMQIERGNAVREAELQNISVLTATAADMKAAQAEHTVALTGIQDILASSLLEQREANTHLTAIEKAIVPMRTEMEKIRKSVEENG